MAADATKDAGMIELSIIIPTHNRAARLRMCLEALGIQTQPASDFEVIVIDDGSDDGTPEMLAEIETPFALRVIRQTKSGQCAALNRGIDDSGRYCLILDDDIIPGPTLVAEHFHAQRESGGIIAVGQLSVRVSASAGWYGRWFAQRWREHYQHLNEAARAPTWQDCYSANLSAPRQALMEVGGFAVDLPAGFDVELGYRLQRSGIPMVYLPDACGEHGDEKTDYKLLSEDERSGRTMLELIRRHPELLPELVGGFWDTSQRAIALRRLLLTLHISPRLLVRLGPILRSERWDREWFRFVSTYAYWYGVQQAAPDRETWQRLTHGTPILMYHAFGKPGEPSSRFVLPGHRFAQQMAWLKRLRFHVLSLEDYLSYRRTNRLPPARSVVVTVDDGYADNYSVAYPILLRYGFPATIFLVSGYVGDANRWDGAGPLSGRALLSWSQIREMLHGGVSFGAHTRAHPILTTVSPDRARLEIAGSSSELEQELGYPILLFSYPHGKFDATTRSMVEQLGFSGACGVRTGMNTPATPEFELRRTEVYGTDSFLRFVLALWLGDDYLPPRRRRQK
jgi:peptidoglycan/xylan/chitin deacetylase (PgdA/CDA1 family)/glycosyltransferase involved in cell wall biosynthesis